MEEAKDDVNVVKVNLQEIAEQQNQEDEVHKVDLTKKPGETEDVEDVKTIEEIKDVEDVEEKTETKTDIETKVEDIEPKDKDDVLVEITGEEEEEEKDNDQASDQASDQVDLPENIQKLADFMKDTGGSIEDFISLNKDVDSMDDAQLLKEYRQAMEPELDSEEIDFLMEDMYESDEDLDTDREIKKKAIAKKRDVSKAKKHLTDLKDKYYDEIKAGSKLAPEQKKAIDFFNRYNKDQEESTKIETARGKVFTQKLNSLFNDEFKGFEFKVGEKRYRYNVKNAGEVKEAQSDINNFAKEYLGDDNTLKDAKGYHKALFTAMNADAIADHFYQQGKADAIKTSAKKAKNIKMDARGVHEKIQNQAGLKARVVESDSSPGKLRIKK